MIENDDIKKICYKVPEGYFDNLRTRLSAIPRKSYPSSSKYPDASYFDVKENTEGKEMAISFWNKFKPYITLAACFALAVMIGSLIVKKTSNRTKEDNLYEKFLSADIIPVTDPYTIYEDNGSKKADDDISDNDIENYLIESGTPVELLGYTTYEENH
jgi:hypothetical protein